MTNKGNSSPLLAFALSINVGTVNELKDVEVNSGGEGRGIEGKKGKCQ
jgi:hypothetical protein